MRAEIVLAVALMATSMTVSATGGGGGGGYTKEFAPGYYKGGNPNMVAEQSLMNANRQDNPDADINTLLEENPTAAGREQKSHGDKLHQCTCEEGNEN